MTKLTPPKKYNPRLPYTKTGVRGYLSSMIQPEAEKLRAMKHLIPKGARPR